MKLFFTRLALNLWDSLILWRLYVIAALVAAGIFAPLLYAPVPWLMLLTYLYLSFTGEGHPSPVNDRSHFKVPFTMALALSLPLFFEPLLGVWFSPLLALPVLPLLDRRLRQFASGYEFAVAGEIPPLKRRRPTPTGLGRSLALSLSLVALLALALNSWSLLLSVTVVAAYFTGLILLILRRTGPQSPAPVSAEIVRHRIVAGDFLQTPVRLINRSLLAGHLRLFSPYLWFSVRPSRLVLDRPVIDIEASLKAPLAGPAQIELPAVFIDPWGLIRFDFTLGVVDLLVIPRARYAEWLARKYLETSRSGGRETTASAASSNGRASRRGIEFYGIRPYQPGDSSRTIDWKHTLKLHQMVVKEFLDTTVECAVLAVNLSVTDEEEKDKVASELITTALTLAGENIPSALAAYSHREVVKTTRILDPRQTLIEALNLTREVRISLNPRRYLAVPDVGRLRANLYRLRQSGYGPANRLAELLQLEYVALVEAAKQNPATAALNTALAGVKGKVNVLVVSGHNHDAAALAFNRAILEGRGYRFLL